MAMNREAVGAVAAVFLELLDDDVNDEEDQNVMEEFRAAVLEIMEMEEGEVIDYINGPAWEPITVDIDEYHRMGDPAFRRHFRMTRIVFERICQKVHGHLHARGRIRRVRRDFEDIMLMVIWLLATPDSFRSVALRFGVVESTLYYFYTYVIEALRELAAEFIVWPEAEERAQISQRFQDASGFPGAVGAIDCTHVNITAPLRNPNQYINRHHSYSINVQSVVDDTLYVRHVHVGEVGSMNDRRVFRRSNLYANLLQNEDNQFLSDGEHLVGDGGYTLTEFMMVPFARHGQLTPQQQNFNMRLSQARVRVENSYALAKGKWRRLKYFCVRNEQNVVDHIMASFVLHNMLIFYGEHLLDPEELRRPIHRDQILEGQENEEMEVVDNLIAGAEMRGIEKRIMIMEMLPPRDA